MATADDAKRAVRELADEFRDAVEHAQYKLAASDEDGFIEGDPVHASEYLVRADAARDALLRAADALIEALAWVARLGPPHEDVAVWARDALARVAAMGDGRDA